MDFVPPWIAGEAASPIPVTVTQFAICASPVQYPESHLATSQSAPEIVGSVGTDVGI